MLSASMEELTAELKNLKRRLYSFQFKGLELQEKARSHLVAHRLAELAGHSTPEEHDENSDLKFQAFGNTNSPLANEYILEMMASYLPMQDLRSCRQVCKLWSKELRRCAHKRKSLVVAFENDCADAREILRNKRLGNCVNISTLVLLEIPLESRIVQDLIWSFGSTMSGLKLDDCSPTAQEVYSCLQKIPCLENFCLKTMSARVWPDAVSLLDQLTSNYFSPKLQLRLLKKLVWEDNGPVCALERLPEMCPNLALLKISNVGDCIPQRFENLEWKSLKVLTMSAEGEFKINHFEALSKMGLKLKKVTLIHVRPYGKRKMGKLQAFLNSQAETLTDVSITDETMRLTGEVDLNFGQDYTVFPLNLPHLKNLKLEFGFINALAVTNDLPSLNRLDYKCRFWRNWWTILFKNPLPSTHKKIDELSLGAIDNECLQRIAISFPNIARLEIAENRIGDWALRTICAKMPQLVNLKITRKTIRKECPLITDSGITGIPEEQCEKMLKEKDFSIKDIHKYRKHPYIGDLKELRILEIGCGVDSPLTDVSIFYGISHLKNLLILALPKCQVSDVPWLTVDTLPTIATKEAGGSRRYLKTRECLANLGIRAYKDLFSDIE